MTALCLGFCLCGPTAGGAVPALPIQSGLALPTPARDPLAVADAGDPILALGKEEHGKAAFLNMIQSTVQRHPALAETRAEEAAARAGRSVARSGLFPTIDLGIVSDQAITRRFGNDLNTIVERSRLNGRTDLSFSASQTLFDFGATSRQIKAANAHIEAAAAQSQDTADRVTMLAIAAYYDLFTYQRLIQLTHSFQQRQTAIRDAVGEHIRQGMSARGDLSRVDASIARIDAQLAAFSRRLADAEARWSELSGLPVPSAINRPEAAGAMLASRDAAVAGAGTLAEVKVADQEANAARQEARAQKAQLLPQVSGEINVGRYGVIEGLSDYDARARLSIRQRLLGGIAARANQSDAQALAAQARADRTREEAERDAAIAWTDVNALETQLTAQRDNYVAARRVRDVEAERFRVERGTLIDLLDAEETYFGVAANYISILTQRDVARFALLQHTGKLADTLELTSLAASPWEKSK